MKDYSSRDTTDNSKDNFDNLAILENLKKGDSDSSSEEIQETINDQDIKMSENDDTDDDEDDPNELTTIYKCPMCFKKFATLSHIENHIFKFHKIPLKVQRQSMHGGHAMSIIKEKL